MRLVDGRRAGPTPSSESGRVEFSLIETHLSCELERTHNNRTLYAVDRSDGGRNSATSTSTPTSDATSTSSSTPDATSSLPVLDPAPPLVPDYSATTTETASALRAFDAAVNDTITGRSEEEGMLAAKRRQQHLSTRLQKKRDRERKAKNIAKNLEQKARKKG